ncbi:uncharacterized protein LOC124258434 [Haliotis rubra]|uniref:uncharacterized protein LOC124258434 n=1 Tax=Haliotis rubra TaxID=36100 RepID=UPI001EE5B125|nr:uncharacterized protein LOC124258434 [Haliotis rubra]
MAANVLGMAFVPYYNHLMTLLETNQELKKSATGIFKQVAWGAGGTIAGGVVGGPVGAMIGGLAGSVIGYCRSDEYQSMIKVLKELTDKDKKRLVSQVQEVVGSTGIETLTRFIGQQAQREILLNVLNKFTTDLKGG